MVEWTLRNAPVLKSKSFRVWLFGRAIMTLGNWMNGLAVPWWILSHTKSPTMVGLAGLAGMLPGLLVLLFGGRYFAKRLSERNIMLTSTAILAVGSGLMALLWYRDNLSAWQILPLSAISGIAMALEFPAREVFLVGLIHDEFGEDSNAEFQNSVTLDVVIPNITRIIGMFLAGWMIKYYGEGSVFAFDAATSVIMAGAILLVAWNGRKPIKLESEGKINRGKAHDLKIPRLSILFVILFAFNLSSVFSPLLTVVVKEIYNREVMHAGLFGMLFAVGSVIGSLFYMSGAMRSHPVGALFLSALIYPLTTIWIVSAHSFEWALFAVCLAGAIWSWYIHIAKPLTHLAVSNKQRGQAMQLWLISFAMIPVFAAGAGWLCESSGHPAFVIMKFSTVALIIISSTVVSYYIDRYFKNGRR